MKQTRAHSLDALRGYAIMTMILSATEAFSILPRWMYHAQVPPPGHVFTPTIYGITWVDLIFPFFLFSMGAAFPLSLGRQFEKGVSKMQLCYKSVLRWLKLCFFAIYIQHLFPFMLGYDNPKVGCVVALCGFLLMFPMFMRNPFHTSKPWSTVINAVCYVIGFLWIYFQPYQGGKPFSPNDTDIIILILANVAVVGSIIYVFTMNNLMARLAVLPILLGIILSAGTDGSWAKAVMDFTPFKWMYEFRYMEYLMLIIPGTIAGDLLSQWLARKNEDSEAKETETDSKTRLQIFGAMVVSLLLVVSNVCCLYNRFLVANLLISAVLLVVLHFLLKGNDENMHFWHKLYTYGAYFLMLGICFEAFQGGIRKDDVTVSYVLLTAGLAFIALVFLSIVCDHYYVKAISIPLEMTGKNPMIAYVSDSLIVIPLLQLTGIYNLFELMGTNPWLGFLKGVIITALCMLVTSVFTRLKWFWKT